MNFSQNTRGGKENALHKGNELGRQDLQLHGNQRIHQRNPCRGEMLQSKVPCASTIPLAADEINKLFNCKYFLQLDGMNAYWSIPVCDESKRLTAFHTPDGIYC
jgi:hypothetical protein